MKPNKLTMTAFGPFKDTVNIEFSSLGSDGLYLISGATGSGKTTLFDALSYALFGVTTSDENRNGSLMRCQWASQNVVTSVELVFSEKGKTYTIKRAPSQLRMKKRGEGLTSLPASAELRLPDGSVLSKNDQVNNKVEEIIGMTADQFAQIVMLAQGKFSRFLASKTDEKCSLFKKIFDTDNYDKLQVQLSEKAKEAKEAYRSMGVEQKTIVSNISVPENSKLYDQLESAKSSEILPPNVIEILDGILSEKNDEISIIASSLQLCDDEKRQKEADIEKWGKKEKLKEDYSHIEAEYQKIIEELRIIEAEALNIPNFQKQKDDILLKISGFRKVLPRYDEKNQLIKEIADKTEEKGRLSEELNQFLVTIADKRNELEHAHHATETLKTLQKEFESENEKNVSIKERMSAFDGLSNILKEYKSVVEALKNEKDSLTDIRNKLEILKGKAIEKQTEKKIITDSLEPLADIEVRQTAAKTLFKTVCLLKTSLSALEKKQGEKRNSEEKFYGCAAELAKAKTRNAEIIRSIYLNGAASYANKLEEGKPCPVCGSLHHPSPAVNDGNSFSEEARMEAEKAEKDATDAMQIAENEKGQIEGAIHTLENEINRYKEILPENLRDMDITDILSEVSECNKKIEKNIEEKKNLLKELDEVDNLLSQLSDRKTQLSESKAAIEKTISVYQDQCSKFEIKRDDVAKTLNLKLETFSEEFAVLKSNKQSSDATLSRLEKDKEKAEQEAGKTLELSTAIDKLQKLTSETEMRVRLLEQTISSKEQEKEKLLSQLEFSSKKEVEEKIIHLEEEKEKLETLISDISFKQNDARTKMSTTEGRLTEIRKQISEIPDYNVVLLREDVETLRKQHDELDKKRTDLVANERIIKAAKNKYLESERTGKTLRERWALLQELSDVANGTLSGENKLSLETFVQTRYLDRILRRANEKLLLMSDQQYEMERSEKARSKGQKMGLDIDVLDHFTCKSRPASTLSGGETFKASLALALGLSEEIQANAGAVKIETMFVDEGFGSLDEDSLRSAVSVLSDLAAGGRLVGVISHIPELKEKIDKQILVEKNRSQGSTVRIKY